ncbi:hypothetical protein Hypma_006369 [Hypsizygus marmoreus]|uniref:Uncharacterized protein n=1 Tax=Hypsizygus marmoreus TaxID=39966 RepID=A0A369JU22_HYPMA|nr:hypothetical protein Hypma_006369 [Hypsizygus marmoreus]
MPRPTKTAPAPKGKHDTRRFSSSRRSSQHGYLDLPNVDGELQFTRLPHFPYYTGRLVRIGQRTWELWSPNSSRYPFYPGRRHAGFLLDPPDILHYRRVDGHLGRFDPTVSPQELVASEAWWPFIRRTIPSGAAVQEYPEFAAVPDIWLHDDKPAKFSGTLYPKFLQALSLRNSYLDSRMINLQTVEKHRPRWWTRRPLYPYSSTFENFAKPVDYDFAVDTVTAMQRGMKLKAAWIELVDRFRVDFHWHKEAALHQEVELRRGIDFADDSFMGAWVNAGSQTWVTWLTRQKIPCFIIHLCTREELAPFPEVPRLPNFFVNSEAEKLGEKDNRYEEIAKRMNNIETDSVPDAWIFPEERSKAADPTKAKQSFSREMGWIDVPGVRSGPEHDRKELPTKPLPSEPLPSDPPSLPSLRPPPPTDVWERCRRPPPPTIAIDPNRVPWIQPPIVAWPTPGQWSKWVEQDDTEVRTVRKIGRSARYDMTGYVYYDRVGQRMIELQSPIEKPPGYVANRLIFGLPAPDIVFEKQAGNDWVYLRSSEWVYNSRHPNRSDIGTTALQPPPENLPLLKDGKPIRDPLSTGSDSDLDDDDDDEGDDGYPAYKAPVVPSAPIQITSAPVVQPLTVPAASSTPPPIPQTAAVPDPPAAQPSPREESPEPTISLGSSSPSVVPGSPEPVEMVIDEPELKVPDIPANLQPERPLEERQDAATEARPMTDLGGNASMVTEISSQSMYVRRFTAGPLGLMDVAAGDLVSRFLIITNCRMDEVSWEDFLMHLQNVAHLYDRAQYDHVVRTIDNGEQVFWLAMASEREALLARGFLASRRTADNMILHCSFVDSAAFQSATARATHQWARPPPPQQPPVQLPAPGALGDLFARMRESGVPTASEFGVLPSLQHRLQLAPRDVNSGGHPRPSVNLADRLTSPSLRARPLARRLEPPSQPSLLRRFAPPSPPPLQSSSRPPRTPSPTITQLPHSSPSRSPPPRRQGQRPPSPTPLEEEVDLPQYRGRRGGKKHRKRGAKKGSGFRSRRNDSP